MTARVLDGAALAGAASFSNSENVKSVSAAQPDVYNQGRSVPAIGRSSGAS